VPAKRPRPRLNRDVICEAALELLAESGADSFSMRALGERLGVDASAFYRHYPDKDALLREVGDRALAPATRGFSTSDDPRDDVRRMCLGVRKALLRSSVALQLTQAGPTRYPNELRITEVLLDAFDRAGLEPDDAVLSYHVFIEYTVGSAALDAPLAVSAQLRRDEYPAIRAHAARLYPSSDVVFLTGLDALISRLLGP
jgi:AcrR family transcriptional regulator